ncbi:bifunctional serine/threonine protein kinase/MFS transporter [Nocardia sp. NPDC127579]|uniref:serine/threonine-protein kinase n=1 Tax=Nocardia sp. NPDC127579 TaxID=3345402 RepID=UPI00363A1E8D
MGETFAEYEIDGVLGQGGMGTVYRARHPRLPRMVALKLLNQDVSADEELRARFEQEANVVARLEHPGIVGIYDRGVQDGHLWISMQYVRGTDADQLDARAMPPERLLRLITDTAHALDYAHSRGVLHRDVKPANILLAEADDGIEERAVLTDFGIARLLESDSKLTATGTFTATLAYASPEQLSGEPINHLADQYSLACTLFTLLAGHSPFRATAPGQIIAAHLSKPVPRLSDSRADLPPALDDVIARAMAKRREDRFASCGDFVAAAAEALRGQPTRVWAKAEPTVVVDHPTQQLAPQTAPQQWAHPPQQPQPAPWGYQQPGAPWPPQPRPSRVTVAMAATLAILFGLALAFLGALMAVIYAAVGAGDVTGSEQLRAIATIAACITLGFMFLVGTIFFLARKPSGRNVVAAAFGGTTFLALAVAGLSAVDGNTNDALVIAVLGLVMPAAGLACTLARSTTRWLAYVPPQRW